MTLFGVSFTQLSLPLMLKDIKGVFYRPLVTPVQDILAHRIKMYPSGKKGVMDGFEKPVFPTGGLFNGLENHLVKFRTLTGHAWCNMA